MFYTWNSEVSKLVRSGASNLSGLIGSQDPIKANFDLLSGSTESFETLEIYKKKDHDVFLVVRKIMGLKIYCKIDCMHGLMQYLAFSKSLQDASEYIDCLNNSEESEDDDKE